ncbi:hypothetical protein ACO0KY_18640 [Undibacterium sp. Dicai25W]|uniref:hypothetical protein n=1 Tax=Undibacterium sp. Dicai25W TaxID=3413034 RepID=UPI003BEFA579
MPSTKIFIDTEFTNFAKPQLISIGLVTNTGAEFYAETPYLENECSDFVKNAVIPLLGKLPNVSCSFDELQTKLLNWLNLVCQDYDEVVVCFDYHVDWELFVYSLQGALPPCCKPRLIGREINKLLRYDFYRRSNLPEHHALYDARAISYSFRERPSVTF